MSAARTSPLSINLVFAEWQRSNVGYEELHADTAKPSGFSPKHSTRMPDQSHEEQMLATKQESPFARFTNRQENSLLMRCDFNGGKESAAPKRIRSPSVSGLKLIVNRFLPQAKRAQTILHSLLSSLLYLHSAV